ncbi:bifunctional uridylyltransferase/uridylyl-removing enzyme [Variibacter gotjawalensis]|uniref:Bifunctional uridylyltransferase/uridylyl-removing enzyme n=1 Tax=Variibacter gotjawalensis TaxID=1333996 RepID=A0A0S3PP76_9BRAD|nr:[protein-PII] uridylyltransferase [Variibacter gotjawalensis]NIK48017.1 [protein-PII] uridylyltransferase [Variibacter gotjawalensis]RZS49894.1 UTP--GlnB (protein PII) uridylyltransferase GlnD [Variibacter gotjawalensis]BAT57722.1 bifunctional uridylyltransferase/uridylyl-removing enzyme [Variibacter gotjawalensis]
MSVAALKTPEPELLDPAQLASELAELARKHRDSELRTAVSQHLKARLIAAKKEAERLLLQDRHGRGCAERLCEMHDAIIRAVYDFTREHLYPSENQSDAERMAIVATGGYGRGLMAPFSDIDLLFLLPYKQTAWGEQIAESILYCLWDMGLTVGHATRSIDECVRQAKADMTIRTGLLEARYILGNKTLFDELQTRFQKDVVQGTGPDFVEAKLQEREERHRRGGQSRYLVEPNVKEGKGGLRDLHALFWIAKYVYQVGETEQLVQKGVFDRTEYRIFRRCEDFLWSVRCHIHFVAGRAEERLSFDIQREIAVRLGYTEHPGQQDVERFMKHYFLMAKDVGDLTAILCAHLEDRQAKPQPMLNRLVARIRPRAIRTLRESDDFVVDKNRIMAAHADVFQRDPVNLIRMFRLAQKHNLAFHPDTMRLITRSLKLIDSDLRDSVEANKLFVEILTSEEAEIVLRRMNEGGVLGKFIPDFGRVVAMMQFNMYHHYTVDEHLLRCIGILAAMERGDQPELGLANELVKSIQPEHRRVLFVALFLHDIAKGRPEDHSIAGAKVARRLGPRFGLNAGATDLLAWLIQEHLTMSTIAQSRDLSDRKTIENFAAVVQSLERLKLLTILTTADIRAVGPGVWNSWKAQLLRTLYYETEPVLTGGFSEVNRQQRVDASQQEFRINLKDWPSEAVEAYIVRQYPAYWLKVDLEAKIAHARFMRAADVAQKKLATRVAIDKSRGVTELIVLAPDHPRLLSIIAGACAAGGANIVDAQIYTTTDGLALDTITITREFPEDHDEERRATRIADTIEKALAGEMRLPEVVAKRAAGRGRIRAFALEPTVLIQNSWSNRYTVIEVTGLDRPGLLYELTATLSKLNLNIASAHVATFGERAVDVFYVTDLMGAKIAAPQRQAAIKRALLHLFERKAD